METIRLLLRQGELPKLEELETLRDLNEMKREHYRDAWAWVHFCLHGSREAYTELVHYLDELESGIDPGKLSDRLRRRIPNLERKLSEHFRP